MPMLARSIMLDFLYKLTEEVISLRKSSVLLGQGAVAVVIVTRGGYNSIK